MVAFTLNYLLMPFTYTTFCIHKLVVIYNMITLIVASSLRYTNGSMMKFTMKIIWKKILNRQLHSLMAIIFFIMATGQALPSLLKYFVISLIADLMIRESWKTTPIRTSPLGKKRGRTKTGRFNTTEEELGLENSSGSHQNVFIVQNSLHSEGHENYTA